MQKIVYGVELNLNDDPQAQWFLNERFNSTTVNSPIEFCLTFDSKSGDTKSFIILGGVDRQIERSLEEGSISLSQLWELLAIDLDIEHISGDFNIYQYTNNLIKDLLEARLTELNLINSIIRTAIPTIGDYGWHIINTLD